MIFEITFFFFKKKCVFICCCERTLLYDVNMFYYHWFVKKKKANLINKQNRARWENPSRDTGRRPESERRHQPLGKQDVK